jgi:hypothetical protein
MTRKKLEIIKLVNIMFLKIKKMLALSSKMFIFVILIMTFSIFVNTVLGAWSEPTAVAPDNNAPGIIFFGDSNSYLGNVIALQHLTFEEDAVYPQKFYINSKKGLQIRIDSDNDESSSFAINNGANAEIFKLEESGLMTVNGRITGADNPIDGTDAATKAYVDQIIDMLP